MSDKQAPYRISSIVGLCNFSNKTSGIYFLCRGNEVVYVGKSLSVCSRIWQHNKENKGKHAKKSYDSVFYFYVPEDQLEEVERLWIKKLMPEYNISGTGWVENIPSCANLFQEVRTYIFKKEFVF